MKALGWFSLALFALALFGLFVVQSLIAMSKLREPEDLRNAATVAMSVPMADQKSLIPRVENFEARDRSLVGFRKYRSKAPTRIKLYLVHSETRDDLQLAGLASALAFNAGIADVFTFDMRGHGQNPLHRGDIDYVGQPTDDLADLIRATSSQGDVIAIGGLSAGAAVAARLGIAPGQVKLSGVLLLAPILSPDFPANKPDLGGWALPLKWRVAALEIQNALGIHWSDREVAVQYAVPAAVWNGPLGYAVTSDYTWRFARSLQLPSDNGLEFARMRASYLAIVGGDDEVIDAGKFGTALQALNPRGVTEIVPQETHFSVVNTQQTLAIIQNWLSKLH